MNAYQVVLLAGLACGVLDLVAASSSQWMRGGSIERLLQSIAAGALGAPAFNGGKKSAALGVLFHFCIALSAAAVYYFLNQNLTFLIRHAVFSGLLYGAVIHLLMTFVVLPLSRLPKRAFSVEAFVTQLLIHIFCVGLPISIILQNLS